MSFTYAFSSVVIVSLLSLVGLSFLAIKEKWLKEITPLLVGLAVGALLGDAFIHLLPEAFAEQSALKVSLLAIGGILLFFILEKFLHFHHHDHDQCDYSESFKSTAKLVLISDGLHNLIDGVIIGVGYLISIEGGIATTIAIILHEVPQELGDFGVLLQSGYTKGKALFFNFLSSLLALLGVGLVFFLGENIEGIVSWVLPITAGMFIYIASSDLVPELHRNQKTLSRTLLEIVSILVGVGVMYLLLFLE